MTQDRQDSIGPYMLLESLGKGAFGEVFHARVQRAGGFTKDVALKTIRFGGSEDVQQARDNALKEARLCGLLKHPNIIDVYDVGDLEDGFYIAMELVEGAGMEAVLGRMRKGGARLHHGLVLEHACDLLSALDYAHTRRNPETDEPLGIVHRDIKPANILLGISGELKLADFGIALWQSGMTTVTVEGSLKGTPLYMSPEQVQNAHGVDHRSDLFSLGLVLIEMLTLRRLFARGNAMLTVFAVLNHDLQEDLDAIDDVPTEIIDAIRPLLQRDPDKRPATTADVLRSFERLKRRFPSDMLRSDFHRTLRSRTGPQPAQALSVASSSMARTLDWATDESQPDPGSIAPQRPSEHDPAAKTLTAANEPEPLTRLAAKGRQQADPGEKSARPQQSRRFALKAAVLVVLLLAVFGLAAFWRSAQQRAAPPLGPVGEESVGDVPALDAGPPAVADNKPIATPMDGDQDGEDRIEQPSTTRPKGAAGQTKFDDKPSRLPTPSDVVKPTAEAPVDVAAQGPRELRAPDWHNDCKVRVGDKQYSLPLPRHFTIEDPAIRSVTFTCRQGQSYVVALGAGGVTTISGADYLKD